MDTVAKQLETALARIAELDAAAQASAKALADAQAEVKALTVANGNLQEAAQASAKALTEAKAAHEVALKAEQQAHEASKAELAKAKEALKNPAFAAAAAAGQKTATEEGGSPASDKPMTKEEAIKAYSGMPNKTMDDARARAEFRKAHAELLGL